MKLRDLFLVLPWILVIVLGAILIFRPSTRVVPEPFDDSALREEIRVKDSIANYWHGVADSALLQVDALQVTKTEIKYQYREIYKTLPTATNQQLDSILRANW